MRVSQKKEFNPISLHLETEHDYRKVMQMLDFIISTEADRHNGCLLSRLQPYKPKGIAAEAISLKELLKQ